MDVNERVDSVLKKRNRSMTMKDLQESQERKDFAMKVEQNPVISKKYDKSFFNCEVINLGNYIRQMSYPDSIYLTDELIRLSLKADLEMKKKYLEKKRNVPMRMIWLIIIVFGIVLGVIIVAMFGKSIMGG